MAVLILGATSMEERIQKLISSAGLMSRRAAEAALSAGRVTVNGRIASLGDKADPDNDIITVDGEILSFSAEKIVIMLNKPVGYVTTLHDEKGRRDVSSLVESCGCRVYPVGRLDMDTEGLLLLTNDGDFANRIMHPSHNVEKTYRVKVTGSDLDEGLIKLAMPVEIDGYLIRKPSVTVLKNEGGSAVADIVIHEGRNRQVRKMCDLAGLKVLKLKRISVGELELGRLKTGEWRYLSDSEISRLLGEDR